MILSVDLSIITALTVNPIICSQININIYIYNILLCTTRGGQYVQLIDVYDNDG